MDNLEYAKALRARTSSKGALARSRQLQCIPIEESLAALPMWAKLGTKLRGVFLKMLRMRKGGSSDEIYAPRQRRSQPILRTKTFAIE